MDSKVCASISEASAGATANDGKPFRAADAGGDAHSTPGPAGAQGAETVPSGQPEAVSQPTAGVPGVPDSAPSVAVVPSAAPADADADDESDDDEAETVEESPCSRWLKRKEEVKYRDVPGIDTAYLAMDSDEGVEVVWNEAQFSTGKKFKAQEDKLKNVFEALTLIDHPNIVKFHKFWTDPGSVNEKTGEKKFARLIFITEYMSSGSLKQFLRRTKKNNRKVQLQSWKRWCTQILSALSYLHQTCKPAITHGNLTCDTIFIQHNGLIKIGSIAPDIIHQNVKTYRDNFKNRHYLAPEFADGVSAPGTPSDVYAFGICALEAAALDILTTNGTAASSAAAAGSAAQASGDGKSDKSSAPSSTASTAPGQQSSAQGSSSGTAPSGATGSTAGETEKSPGVINDETIQRTVDLLEDSLQKDFIRRCLKADPKERPTARELLFHPVLFEVHSLKLLAAHSLVNSPGNINDAMTDEAIQSHYGPDTVMATVRKKGESQEYKLSNVPVAEKLEKFMEDVKFGIFPITAYALSQPPPPKTRAVTPEGPSGGSGAEKKASGAADGSESEKSTEEPEETRRVTHLMASLAEPPVGDGAFPKVSVLLVLIFRFEDCQNRMLHAHIVPSEESPKEISEDIIKHRFISKSDEQLFSGTLGEVIRKWSIKALAFQLLRAGIDLPEDVREHMRAEDLAMHRQPEAYAATSDEEKKFMRKKLKLGKLRQYFTKAMTKEQISEAMDPQNAILLRDPTGVADAHPLPEGAHFTGPVPEEGSQPYRLADPATNPFDTTQIEAQIKAAGGDRSVFGSLLPESSLVETPAVAAMAPPPTAADESAVETPKSAAAEGSAPAVPTDTTLKGATQVLEGLQLQGQLQAEVSRGSHTPSVSPGQPQLVAAATDLHHDEARNGH